jgi:hypothetical protein
LGELGEPNSIETDMAAIEADELLEAILSTPVTSSSRRCTGSAARYER